MRRGVTISTGAIALGGRLVATHTGGSDGDGVRRAIAVVLCMVLAFGAIGGQLVRLALKGGEHGQSNMTTPIASGVARPDVVDRKGRLLASDVEALSLYADPMIVIDRDEVSEKLARIFPDLDTARLRQALSDRSRRFVWVRRGLSPDTAQRVHNLGLPGLAFRPELRRAYPSGRLAGHVLGGVNIDNRSVAGIERYLDEKELVDSVVVAAPSERRPVALSLDVGVQHALEDELAKAMTTYDAPAAAGLVLDVTTGEIVASASLPGVDPAIPDAAPAPETVDRVSAGRYELGSIFKLLTLAEAIDAGRVGPQTIIDVTQPLNIGRYEIKDLHPSGRPLTVGEVFLKSSNVGAGILALGAGAERQRDFLSRLGLLEQMRAETGALAAPLVPERWQEIETVTISYGHGLAVPPLQFAAAAAAMVNGGNFIQPTFLKRRPGEEIERRRVISAETSARLNELMRRNVAEAGGTGRRADAAGYRVGGKTGTAEIAHKGRYEGNSVISSFLAAFPMEAPQYLSLVILFEPSRTAASGGEITAGQTAAPVTARLVERIAPQLGVLPILAASGER